VPLVVFVAELEVAEHDRHLGAGDDEDEQHQREEAEHVVEALHEKKKTQFLWCELYVKKKV